MWWKKPPTRYFGPNMDLFRTTPDPSLISFQKGAGRHLPSFSTPHECVGFCQLLKLSDYFILNFLIRKEESVPRWRGKNREGKPGCRRTEGNHGRQHRSGDQSQDGEQQGHLARNGQETGIQVSALTSVKEPPHFNTASSFTKWKSSTPGFWNLKDLDLWIKQQVDNDFQQ